MILILYNLIADHLFYIDAKKKLKWPFFCANICATQSLKLKLLFH